jgi:enamine deaminase RidA (YjgF/YER057c/UK114 family)
VILPEPPRPLGHYEAAVQTGSLLVLSGMLPLQHGAPTAVGRLGDRLSLDEGRAAARLAALNALAAAAAALGSVDRIRRVVRAIRVDDDHPRIRGSRSRRGRGLRSLRVHLRPGHTRVALGAYSLPLGAAIVLDVIYELRIEADHVEWRPIMSDWHRTAAGSTTNHRRHLP